MTTVEVLKKARELLARDGWTKYALARDAGGHIAHLSDPDAAKFCAAGAIKRVAWDAYDGYGELFASAVAAVEARCHGASITYMNDTAFGVEFVLARFDEAIHALEGANEATS